MELNMLALMVYSLLQGKSSSGSYPRLSLWVLILKYSLHGFRKGG